MSAAHVVTPSFRGFIDSITTILSTALTGLSSGERDGPVRPESAGLVFEDLWGCWPTLFPPKWALPTARTAVLRTD
jgi:hypothetical protein